MTTALLLPYTATATLSPIRESVSPFSLLGKKAFVTGGSRGIGRACAVALAAAGADVAVGSSASGADLAEDLCRELRGSGRRAECYDFDVTAPNEVADACARMAADFDGIDILVNNAGVTRDRSFKKMDRDSWDTVIETNLTAVYEVTRGLIDGMAARGWGRVVNVSSIVGRVGNFGQANYAAAKAGLIGLTKTLAREYARKGVTVNAVAPGFVKTRMLDGIPDNAMQAVLGQTPVGRLGEPDGDGVRPSWICGTGFRWVPQDESTTRGDRCRRHCSTPSAVTRRRGPPKPRRRGPAG
jgi:3-oxoacyl-[acyl-carrier protein] reductase